jgi:hypothetical protein
MRVVVATLIAYIPLFFLLLATSGDTLDWSGMWLYYLAVAAVPVIAGLERSSA